MKVKPLQNCNICSMMITTNEDYCILVQMSGIKKMSEGYYHVQCYRDKFIVPNQALMGLIKKSNVIFDRAGLTDG